MSSLLTTTSHIEWYLSRGIDISVVISMRDRSISRAAKHREHCAIEAVAEKEDEIAMTLINEAIDKYGTRGNGEERVILVSYEGLMEFRETYLFDLYYQVSLRFVFLQITATKTSKDLELCPIARYRLGLHSRFYRRELEICDEFY